MTARTGLLNNHRQYGVNDIGAVLSPSDAQDEVFSLLDIEDVLDPPDLDAGRDNLSMRSVTYSVTRHR